MLPFHWHNNLCIGIDKIDDHNRVLIANLESLVDAIISEPVSQGTRKLFLDLLDYAVFHFACEEIWMSHPRYQFIAEHHAAHAMLYNMFCDVHELYIHDNCDVVSELARLAQSLSLHIKKYDKEYAHWCSEVRC